MPTIETTIRELIAEMPAGARILANHDIDFCGNAKRSLEEVCRGRRMSADTLLQEIETAFARDPRCERTWEESTLRDLMDYILTKHHGYLRRQLPWIEAMARRIEEKHGEANPFLTPVRETVTALREELEAHLRKEEVVLFPFIAKMDCGEAPGQSCFGTVANPIRMMEYEHDSAKDALKALRQLTGGYTVPPRSCLTFRILYFELAALEADLFEHIRLENEVLHPRAKEMEQELSLAKA